MRSDSILDEVPGPLKDRFVYEAKLGEGGAGIVFKVSRKGRVYALKILLGHVLSDRRQVERFLLEGQILARLAHPNVLAVHEVGEDPSCPYLLCDYVDGPAGDQIVRDRAPLPWKEAFSLVGDVLAGLSAAHEQKIIHRDIKPSNILTTQGGVIKLADFGIAKAHDMSSRKTTTGMIVGSPAYMAPEILRGQPASVKTDLYSVGIMLFEFLAGRLPFPDDGTTASMIRRLRDPAPLLSTILDGVPKPLDELLSTALDVDPVNRFPGAGSFSLALKNTGEVLDRCGVKQMPTLVGGTKAITPDWETPDITPGPEPRHRPKARLVVIPQTTRPVWIPLALTGLFALTLMAFVLFRNRPTSQSHEIHDPRESYRVPELTSQERGTVRTFLALRPDKANKSQFDSAIAALGEGSDDRRAVLLYHLWRVVNSEARPEMVPAILMIDHVLAVPLLVAILTDDELNRDRQDSVSDRLVELVSHQRELNPEGKCPDVEVIVPQLCSLLDQTIRKETSGKVVHAVVLTLGWLRSPDTPCIEAITQAPQDSAWIANLGQQTPTEIVRWTLERIDSDISRDERARMGSPRRDPRDLSHLSGEN